MLNILQQLFNISDPEQLYALDDVAPVNSPLHFLWKNKTGHYLGCSPQLAKNLGFAAASDIIGHTDFDLCWAASAPRFKLNDDQVIHSQKVQVAIETGKLCSGKTSTATSYKSPLRSSLNNKIAGVICIAIELDNLSPEQDNDHRSLAIDSLAAYNLSPRQNECLFYLSKGMSIKQIAARLQLSPRTIEHYLEAVKEKLGCYSRAQLIAKIATE